CASALSGNWLLWYFYLW
nr:immunoglobulin heavy chain junction region [Macaca mulatta]MOW75723.1 immunoglobulin heavy chain junction region [Macaca mulatta]MOW77399.1 immunoglobulin heavy chain junction region [Macaca mulatta]MOW78927.1 immunoglobulin heavy chain junction region [Macaca mulatta]MOW79057.1 immunoglobulin heavy chain junction region [Macaca mulatta]